MRVMNRENTTLLIMGLTFGFVFVDRLSINFLMPFITDELKINNTQIGLLASALAVSWAISGYILSNYCTKNGNRVAVLIGSVVLFSLLTVFSSFSTSFIVLLGFRILMGVAEGPVLPISQSILIESSSEKRRGFNMGFVQNAAANLFGSVLAPMVLIYVAENYGWRNAFIVAGVPGLLVAYLIYRFIHLPKSVSSEQASASNSGIHLLDLLKNRNVVVSMFLSCMMVTWMFSQLVFMPVYLTKIQHYTGYQMGTVMSVLGISAVVSGLVVPSLSDMFGRTTVFRLFALLSIFCPLCILYLYQYQGMMMISMFVLYFGLGAVPLVMATIPSESVSAKHIVGTLGVVMGVSEVLGGFIGPSLSGVLADHFGMQAAFYFASTLALCAFLLSFALKETAPKFVSAQVA